MMNFLFDYGMFLAKSLTVAACLLLVIAGATAMMMTTTRCVSAC